MVPRSVTFAMGHCPYARPRFHSVSAKLSSNEERVRERDVPLRRDGLSEKVI